MALTRSLLGHFIGFYNMFAMSILSIIIYFAEFLNSILALYQK
jgi:hypothetical protein